jgi:hypothetical protein
MGIEIFNVEAPINYKTHTRSIQIKFKEQEVKEITETFWIVLLTLEREKESGTKSTVGS